MRIQHFGYGFYLEFSAGSVVVDFNYYCRVFLSLSEFHDNTFANHNIPLHFGRDAICEAPVQWYGNQNVGKFHSGMK